MDDVQAGVAAGRSGRKGETGTTVIYASRFTKSEADGNGGEVERDIPFLKAYTVFNVAQIDGLPDQYYDAPEPVISPSSASPMRINSSATRAR